MTITNFDKKSVSAIPQEPPKYYGYWKYANAGYSDITRCRRCFNIGLREDCHPADCCKHCGGKVVDDGAAKWMPPVYTGILWWKRTLTEGYWKRA